MADAWSDDEEPVPAAGPGPSSRTRRRQASKGLQFRIIPCCFSSFQKPFCRTGIARLVEQWVKDVHRILVETHMFINFHILWCLENNRDLPASLSDTFFYRAHAAVSNPRGGVQPTFWHSEAHLQDSYAAYSAWRPQAPMDAPCPKSDRFPHIKPVALTCRNHSLNDSSMRLSWLVLHVRTFGSCAITGVYACLCRLCSGRCRRGA